MALVRILVDGYSLLHHWLKLAPDLPRHAEGARRELVHWLTRYYDAAGTPISVFFDGSDAAGGEPPVESTREVEILYSRSGQTADQMIERTVHRMAAHGEVLVVTDDLDERETVQALGGMTASCEGFVRMVEQALTELEENIRKLNRREQRQFNRPPLP